MSYFEPYLVFGFLIALIVVYNICPKKIRPIILLLSSMGFFAVASKFLIVFILLTIVSIYYITCQFNKLDLQRDKLLENLDKEEKKALKTKYKKKKRSLMIIGIIFNVSFLFYFKYLNFFGTNANILFDKLNLDMHYTVRRYLSPIGISFYTLQALSYVFDVYSEKIKASKNFLKVALYLSFFPQIMEGPIAKFSYTADDLYAGHKVTYENFCFGYQRIFFGFLKKFIIADRLNIVVQTIFDSYSLYTGAASFFGAVAYTIMLYMEFSGTMDIVLGIGEIFGVKIPENFKQPFFAKSVSEFWTRWHISLGRWFKDYIFYPVSLSKPIKHLTLKSRKVLGNRFGPLVGGAIALFAVWSLNGLWHGAGWTFIFYGMYHFTMILLGNIFEPTIKNICKKLHINREAKPYRVFRSIKMTIIIFFGELFFNAPTMKVGCAMTKRIFTNFHLKEFIKEEFLSLGLDRYDYLIILVTLIVIFIIGLLKENKVDVRLEISKKKTWIKWIIYYLLILSIIIFGAYGPGYIPVDPIYADF